MSLFAPLHGRAPAKYSGCWSSRLAWLFCLLPLSCQPGGNKLEQIQRRGALCAADGSAADSAADSTAGSTADGVPAESGAPGCLNIPPEGCCDGEALWWCEDSALQSLSCADRPFCGWSSAGFFDCDTSGQTDPSGRFLKNCKRLLGDGDAFLPTLDAGLADTWSDACFGVPQVGCCAGQVLRFCQGGALQEIDCALNTSCGWAPNGQFYDCGTMGAADPLGRFPLSCPGPLPDASPDGPADASNDGLREGGTAGGDGGGGGGGGGCHCAIDSAGSFKGLWPLSALLLLLPLLAARRRL